MPSVGGVPSILGSWLWMGSPHYPAPSPFSLLQISWGLREIRADKWDSARLWGAGSTGWHSLYPSLKKPWSARSLSAHSPQVHWKARLTSWERAMTI